MKSADMVPLCTVFRELTRARVCRLLKAAGPNLFAIDYQYTDMLRVEETKPSVGNRRIGHDAQFVVGSP